MFKSHEADLMAGASSIAEETMNKSKTEFCPVDTGALRDSITMSTIPNGFQISSDVPYALKVHETPQNYDSGTHHYLSTPLTQVFEAQFSVVASKIVGGM
jgi:hypothetical protein